MCWHVCCCFAETILPYVQLLDTRGTRQARTSRFHGFPSKPLSPLLSLPQMILALDVSLQSILLCLNHWTPIQGTSWEREKLFQKRMEGHGSKAQGRDSLGGKKAGAKPGRVLNCSMSMATVLLLWLLFRGGRGLRIELMWYKLQSVLSFKYTFQFSRHNVLWF